MSNDASSRGGALSWGRLAIVSALWCAAVVAWGGAIITAARMLHFEPTTIALQEAEDARLPALAWGLLLAAVAVTLAGVSGHRWLALLGTPGLVVAVVVLLDLRDSGSALFLGLATTLLSVFVSAFLADRERVHRLRHPET